MCPPLNFSGQTTCLSSAARAWKPPLPDGVTSLVGERHRGVGDLALRHLRSSIMLQRSSWLRPYSYCQQFCVIRRRTLLSARRRLPLADAAASLWACFARLSDRLPMEGSPWWLLTDRSAAMTWLAGSAPCWAKARRGEPYGAMCWIDSMIVWSHTALKSKFRFRANLSLGVWTSDASDLLMVGYLLELFCEGAPVGATMMMRRSSSAEFQQVLISISG
jgi:hypothetical protein